jgi:FkbM family methyltransferase
MNDSRIEFYIEGTRIDFVVPYYLHIKALLTNIIPYGQDMIANIASRIGEIKYVVDVGACVGSWAIPYSMVFPEAEILAIEPASFNYQYLIRNIQDFPKIRPLQMVVGSTDRSYRISSPSNEQREKQDVESNTGLITIYGKGLNNVEIVEGKRLDNIVNQKVDWLKIDVEGAEYDVLYGASRVMNTDKPILQIEVRDDNQSMAGRNARQLITTIENYGYVRIGMFDADWICVPQ